MFSEIERLKGSTYIPSPENANQFRALVHKLVRKNAEYIFELDLTTFDDDDLWSLAQDYEEIRAFAMSLKRFADGRLRKLKYHVRDER